MNKLLYKHLQGAVAPPEPAALSLWEKNTSLISRYVWVWHLAGPTTSQGKPSSGQPDTLLGAREHRGHSGGTPAESGASTPQSVMETDPLISAIRLLVACTNTLLSINTVTWHTHMHCSINAHSRGGCHTYLIWFQLHKPSRQQIVQAGYTGPHMQTHTHTH